MKVECAMNQKGGAGKTTLLLHLLITAWLKGRVVSLIDLDPQRSAEKFYEHRERPVSGMPTARTLFRRIHPPLKWRAIVGGPSGTSKRDREIDFIAA